LGRSLPLSKIQLWPKKFDACVADRTALLTHAQRANSITYFIGFRIDTLRMRGNQLDVERQLANFRTYELSKFYPLCPGMDIFPRSFGVKELPKICFLNEGGKVAAMKRRRMLIEADPKRLEAKNKKKLAKLKKKMEAIQRKKVQAESAANEKSVNEEVAATEVVNESLAEDDALDSPKRKREDDGMDMTQGNSGVVKGEEEEEAALLESALDTIEGAGVAKHKTREEAEIDRQKLLAGELLCDGEGEADQEDTAAAAGKSDKQERKLTRAEREAQILKRAGLVIVSDDEATVLGGNRILPWRHGYRQAKLGVKKEEFFDGADGNGKVGKKTKLTCVRTEIKFKTKFDVVELDASGRVIDKGDNDFTPSLKWIGRKGGFEFKLGERGLGYYRTGTKVIVPSNVSYS